MEVREVKQADHALMRELYARCIVDGIVSTDLLEDKLLQAEGFLLYKDKRLLGFISYRLIKSQLQILMIRSYAENKGYGNLLLRTVLNWGIDENVERISVQVTNDNLRGLRFFQRMGFSICKVHRNAVNKIRRQNPEMPLYNDFIKIEHTLELEQIFF